MKVRVLNLGAGVQSTTVALMGAINSLNNSRGEPLRYEPVGLIDFAIFADTQEEPSAVYDHLEWLENRCLDSFPILRVSRGSLGQRLLQGMNASGQRFVSIPAFTAEHEGHKNGIIKRQCTREYKVEMIERAIRERIFGIGRGHRMEIHREVEQIYGLSYDEAGRIARVKGIHPWWSVPSFPLFDLEMTRKGCVTWLKKQEIPHEVPRSACVFCPYRRTHEWRWLKENDESGWQRALEIDRAIRDHDSRCAKGLVQQLYLHESCVPLEQVDLSTEKEKDEKKGQLMFGFNQECEGMCGV